ncbi:MAG: histidine phosphatase family protein [Candidatus Micrarchaeia archaeon]|jgi:broad specificity phosphatase PhoE
MARKIFLVRHGEADSNAGGFFAGWKDVPLTPLGHQQAVLLSRRLLHEPIGRAYCSDLLRAKQTLEGISLICPKVYSSALREKNYGELEGVKWEENEKKYEKYHLDSSARAPGGENNEDVQRRVCEYFEKTIINSAEDQVLVVSHHGPLVLFACHMLGVPISNWRRLRLGNCGLSIFSKEGKTWRMTLWNSLSYSGLENFRPLLSSERR